MRTTVNYFVSYAHANRELANDLLRKLDDVLKPSRTYAYRQWKDTAIVVGEDWKSQILEAMKSCDLGILLVSPAFLGSQFICESELPHFVGQGRARSFPIMLRAVDFKLHDLRGLEALQIFRYQGPKFRDARAYSECKDRAREAFALEAFRAIENKLTGDGRK